MPPSLHKTCRVLYLEDTPEDQRMLLEAIDLACVAVTVQAALTAESALKWLAMSTEFHVLLLDWNLPAVTAVEFLTGARQLRPTLPILVISGEPGTVDKEAAAGFGAHHIVAKPLDLDQWEALAKSLCAFCENAQVAST